jgi:hypothetical protein
MLNPLKWKYEDQARLLFAAAFGALLGFANTGGSIYFGHLSGRLLLAGAPQCPLSGVKRTSAAADPMSAFDPKRKSGTPFCCDAQHSSIL